MIAPIIFANLWEGDIEIVEKSYWTARYYKPSGFELEHEWTNIYAASEEDAKAYARSRWSIAQGLMYRLYAFKQDARIF